MKKFGQLTDNLMDVERQIRSLSHELSNTYFDEHKEFGDLIQDLIQKATVREESSAYNR